MRRYYASVRTLHLYFGLFISPFVLIFSISVLVLNHSQFFNELRPGRRAQPVSAQLDHFKFESTDLLTAKSIINQLGISGEIDWMSKNDSTFSFPVNKAGLIKRISLNTKTGAVVIQQNDVGSLRGMVFLHIMPGQHLAAIRGNSFFMKLWRIMTDVFVYIVLFLSVTGVFMWYFLRPERKLGIMALVAGFLFLTVLLTMLF